MSARRWFVGALGALLSLSPVHVRADEAHPEFRRLVKVLGFGTLQDPGGSTQNPDNLLEIPSSVFETELRLDMSLDYGPMSLLAKPRLNGFHAEWDEGRRSGESDTDADAFVHEWEAALALGERLRASYGRENLQWGPSALASPSNPFIRDNGRRNPKREVPGADFAKVLWIPSGDWSVSVIVNTDEGRARRPGNGDRTSSSSFSADPDFRRAYALKLDCQTFEKYASAIGWYREAGGEDEPEQVGLGGFAGWAATDALLLHAEASATSRGSERAPVDDPSSPFGIRLVPARTERDDLAAILLLGGSYTLESGPTFTVEYLFNGEGYKDLEAERYFDLRRAAASAVFMEDERALIGRHTLAQTLDPGLRLLRRNYVLVQVQRTRIRNVLDVILRGAFNADDRSGQFVPVLQCDVGDHAQLFLTGIQNFGPADSEFRSLGRFTYSLGIEYTF